MLHFGKISLYIFLYFLLAPNTPNLHNGAFWYYTLGKSIVFAPNSTIKQMNADNYDYLSNQQRVS